MTFGEWLQAKPGRATAAASYFRVSLSAISQWATNGVPVRRMKAVRDFTAGEVTLEVMVPGLEEQDIPSEEARDAA
jgi:DNA-binding transcriptional regulator YdaS (Cro superfamily)